MTGALIPVTADDLVAMDGYAAAHPLRIDLVYARSDHPQNIFGCAPYRKNARMWAHKLFAPVILRAAEICHAESGHYFELTDCLRTTEAQALMVETEIVKANPSWTQEPNRMLSSPGQGGHPRGMAVDIVLVNEKGGKIDMGTPFDYISTDPGYNPSARAYTNFPRRVLENRRLLESSMMRAAAELGLPLLPLPQEWWDFRFPYEFYSRYAPVSDADLPAEMRMTS